MDFADYFYVANCITTMNICCDAPLYRTNSIHRMKKHGGTECTEKHGASL